MKPPNRCGMGTPIPSGAGGQHSLHREVIGNWPHFLSCKCPCWMTLCQHGLLPLRMLLCGTLSCGPSSWNLGRGSRWGWRARTSSMPPDPFHLHQSSPPDCKVRAIVKRNYSDLPTNVRSSAIHNSQKAQTTHMSVNRWMDKMWHTLTTAYYSSLKGLKFWYRLQHTWTLKTLC